VLSNPPYVPVAPEADTARIPPAAGPAWAWDAGDDGRLVLDPLCAAAPELLADGGSIVIVQSEFADVDQTLTTLARGGLDAEVLASQWIPFGPVLSARANWLEATGLLVVIRADKR
jgi:release factor glutamine methyltransferase